MVCGISLVPIERTLRPREARSRVLRAVPAEASTREGDTAVTSQPVRPCLAHMAGQNNDVPQIDQVVHINETPNVVFITLSKHLFVHAGALPAISQVVSARRAAPANMQWQLHHAGGFLDPCRIEIVRHCGNLGDGSCQSFRDCLSVPASPGSATPKSRVGLVRSALFRGVRRVAQRVER